MVMNLDLELFCENLKATKPPYECPLDGCGKIYKSYAGIQFHLYNCDHASVDSSSGGGLSPNSLTPSSPGRHSSSHQLKQFRPSMIALPQLSCETMVRDGTTWIDVDLSGSTYKLNIHEPLVLLNDDVAEKSEKETVERNSFASKDCTNLHKVDSGGGSTLPSVKLPEAQFKVLEDYVQPNDVPSKPSNYYRFIEKTQEEIEDEVEYDLDEEDFVWLDLMNEKRMKENLPCVSKDTLELLMDRFEKHCYFDVKTTRRLPRDEDAICSVCLDGECHINNVILFCDLCNLAVHQECYGVPHIPEGSWICRRCLLSPSKSVECCLCPNKRGAFKQTEDGRWAHVICALWIPEVGFANVVFLEPIDGIERIAAARWKLVCYICKQRGMGACIQCHKTSCYTAFHVTCAQQAGLYMKTEPIRETGIHGTTPSVKKTAFCDIHSPLPTDSSPMIVSSSEDDKESSCSSLLPAVVRAKSKLKLRKARKALAESRNSSPTVAIPVISPTSIKDISDRVSFRSKEEFMRRLCSYWSLKRQSRNGVPLLRTSMSSIHISRNRGSTQQPLHSPTLSASSGQKSKVAGAETSEMTLEKQFKYCKQLRQQLEKVRLLNELIRKREKLKQEHLKVHQKVLKLQLSPFNVLLSETLNKLQEKDTQNRFTQSASSDSLWENDSGSSALDFAMMKFKLDHLKYMTVDEMANDFNAMISCYMKRNSHDAEQIKACSFLKEQGTAIFKAANRMSLRIGYDPKTGLHLSDTADVPASQLPSHSADEPQVVEREKPLINDNQLTMAEAGQNASLISQETATASKSEMPMNSEPVAVLPSPAASPFGINRRSAVLHSKKARQSAMRLFGSLKQQGQPNVLVNEVPVVKESNVITQSNACIMDRNENCSEASVGQSLSMTVEKVAYDRPECQKSVDILPGLKTESENSVKNLSKVSSDTSVGTSENPLGIPPPSLPESNMVTGINAENAKQEQEKSRKRKCLESENSLPSDKNGSSHSSMEEEHEDDDDDDDGNNRQYATRGKRLNSRQSSESEEIIVPLEPLDLVWAKCTGFPWYPALVIDPKISKNTAFHNSVALPVPSASVLNLRKKYNQPMFLVSFFDARRTWQWLPREKLDPLGVDSGLDDVKLAENKKPSMRQAVRAAYQKAIQHRCMVTGEPLKLASILT